MLQGNAQLELITGIFVTSCDTKISSVKCKIIDVITLLAIWLATHMCFVNKLHTDTGLQTYY